MAVNSCIESTWIEIELTFIVDIPSHLFSWSDYPGIIEDHFLKYSLLLLLLLDTQKSITASIRVGFSNRRWTLLWIVASARDQCKRPVSIPEKLNWTSIYKKLRIRTKRNNKMGEKERELNWNASAVCCSTTLITVQTDNSHWTVWTNVFCPEICAITHF